MAVYRCISTGFWTDRKILNKFSPEDKLFWLYLLTNDFTTLSGCYVLKIEDAASDLGWNEDTVNNLLRRFRDYHKVIKTSDVEEGKVEVLILNWGKYNWNRSPKNIAGIRYDAENIITAYFKEYVLSKIPEKKQKAEAPKRSVSRFPVEEDNTPDLGDCQNYAKSKGLKGYTGTAFYYSQERTGWKDGNGNPINDWRKYFDRCVENGSIGQEVI